MTAPSIAERVAAGARWLDEHRPGWVDRIDLDTLDLGDPCQCVLGQEFGDEATGLQSTGFNVAVERFASDDLAWVSDHGFDVGKYGAYPPLKTAWRDLIQQRRAAP